MAIERPNLADVNADGLQDVAAPTPEYLFRKILERLRAEGRRGTVDDLRPILYHLRAIRDREE